MYRDKDVKLQFLKRMGILDYGNQLIKRRPVNKIVRNHINVSDSIYANAVQRSDYLQVDQNLMYDIHKHPEKLERTNVNKKKMNLAPWESEEDQPINMLFFKYCKADEVNEKRHIFCLFKATFEAKLIKMK